MLGFLEMLSQTLQARSITALPSLHPPPQRTASLQTVMVNVGLVVYGRGWSEKELGASAIYIYIYTHMYTLYV